MVATSRCVDGTFYAQGYFETPGGRTYQAAREIIGDFDCRIKAHTGRGPIREAEQERLAGLVTPDDQYVEFDPEADKKLQAEANQLSKFLGEDNPEVQAFLNGGAEDDPEVQAFLN